MLRLVLSIILIYSFAGCKLNLDDKLIKDLGTGDWLRSPDFLYTLSFESKDSLHVSSVGGLLNGKFKLDRCSDSLFVTLSSFYCKDVNNTCSIFVVYKLSGDSLFIKPMNKIATNLLHTTETSCFVNENSLITYEWDSLKYILRTFTLDTVIEQTILTVYPKQRNYENVYVNESIKFADGETRNLISMLRNCKPDYWGVSISSQNEMDLNLFSEDEVFIYRFETLPYYFNGLREFYVESIGEN